MQDQSGGVSTSDDAVDGALRRLDAAVAALHAALLPNTLFMVFTGHVRCCTHLQRCMMPHTISDVNLQYIRNMGFCGHSTAGQTCPHSDNTGTQSCR